MMTQKRSGFTLIEVMVAVMIIAVVIAALLQLFSNNTHQLQNMGQRFDDALDATLLLGLEDEGFEGKSTTMEFLVEAFELEDELRRRLKSQRVTLVYDADLQLTGDESASSDLLEEEGITDETLQEGEGVYLEIGRTRLQYKEGRAALVRLRLTQ